MQKLLINKAEQSKKNSLLESVTNAGTFFIVAAIFQYFVMFELVGAQVSFIESIGWSAIYTSGAIVWQYMIRRIFIKMEK